MKWIIVIIFSFILQQFLPWWSIAIAGFLYGIIFHHTNTIAFLNGFFGVFVLWTGMALYIYFINDGILARRLAAMLYLSHGLPVVILTGITGGIIAGMAALLGKMLQTIILKEFGWGNKAAIHES